MIRNRNKDNGGDRLDGGALAHARTLLKLVCRDLAPDLEASVLGSGAVERLSRAIVLARRAQPASRRPRPAAPTATPWAAWDAELEAMAYVTLASVASAAALRLECDGEVADLPEAAELATRLLAVSEEAADRAATARQAAEAIRQAARRPAVTTEEDWAALIDPSAEADGAPDLAPGVRP